MWKTVVIWLGLSSDSGNLYRNPSHNTDVMEAEGYATHANGHRVLAAIVFTDAVDFSARVGRDEDSAVSIIKRDLDLMTKLCVQFEGKVVKSRGDGLMMLFTSAVQAVSCGLEIQKALAEAAEYAAEDQVMLHRIGIHLGDVLVADEDALGDGVNVAARLEQEAEPGGICLSQTVYDVVKGRLFLQAVRVGDLKLKNISDPVAAYKVVGISPKSKKLPAKSSLHWIAACVAGVALVGFGASLSAMYYKGKAEGAEVNGASGPNTKVVKHAVAADDGTAFGKQMFSSLADEMSRRLDAQDKAISENSTAAQSKTPVVTSQPKAAPAEKLADAADKESAAPDVIHVPDIPIPPMKDIPSFKDGSVWASDPKATAEFAKKWQQQFDKDTPEGAALLKAGKGLKTNVRYFSDFGKLGMFGSVRDYRALLKTRKESNPLKVRLDGSAAQLYSTGGNEVVIDSGGKKTTKKLNELTPEEISAVLKAGGPQSWSPAGRSAEQLFSKDPSTHVVDVDVESSH